MTTVDIKKRDFLARTGFFTHGGERIPLPAVVNMQDLFPDLAMRTRTNIPLAAPAAFVTKYHSSGPTEPFEVHPNMSGAVPSGSCVMVANWHTAFHHPRDYVGWLLALRERIPCDTLWYAPAAATPATVSVLAYSGFGIFDFLGVDLRSAQGQFCTPEGDFPGDWINDGGCGCAGCREGDIREHNRTALLQEVHTVRRFIERGQLRELLEARSRLHPAHVAILRHMDGEEARLGGFMPVVRNTPLLACSSDSLTRIEVRRFARRIVERYVPPAHGTVILLPCSARKPYSSSKTHRTLMAVIRGRGHECIVTSPLGLVPRELEGIYPAAHYDVPVTGHWDREELAWAAGIIAAYFTAHPARRIIAHLEGGALKAAHMAAEQCGIALEETVSGSVLGKNSLARLDAALATERPHRIDTLRGILSWQFNTAVDTTGISPRRTFSGINYTRGTTILFTSDTATGLVRPTHAGWKLIPGGYRVEIDDFLPQGDILVPGILRADEQILEGDEVFVHGPRATATGRAAMGAFEMVHSRHGIAIRVRKVQKVKSND
ncbi:MAG: archaeosine synthase subunit alpha [Methanomicrobiales archaeon]|nr:archaeosine synthase subunit alpha [Methanomicrobiales archaeon]